MSMVSETIKQFKTVSVKNCSRLQVTDNQNNSHLIQDKHLFQSHVKETQAAVLGSKVSSVTLAFCSTILRARFPSSRAPQDPK